MPAENSAPARRRFLARHRKHFVIAIVAIGVGLLLATFALPAWIKSAAESFVADKTGHKLTLAAVRFDPLALALRVEGLQLEQPDGKPLLSFRELLVDVSAASVTRRAFVFDSIRLDAPQASVALLADGKLNWSAFVDALKTPDDQADAAPPRIDIDRLLLGGGRVDFADRSRSPGFETRFEPLDLELTNVSTLPNDQGEYRIAARTTAGARIDWRGRFTLAPVAVSGSFELSDAALAQLAPYLEGTLAVAPPEGKARLSTEYRIAYDKGRLDAALDKLALGITGLSLRGDADKEPTLALERIDVKDGRFDLASRKLSLGGIDVGGGRLLLVRDADARLNIEDWFAAATAKVDRATGKLPAAAPAVPGTVPPAAAEWQIELGHFALNDLAVRVDDRPAGEPRSLQVDKLALQFAATARFGAAAPAVEVRDFGAGLDRIAISLGKLPPVIFDRLALEEGRFDLAARSVALGRATLAAGKLELLRKADGKLPLIDALLLTRSGAAAPAVRADAPAAEWHYRVDEVKLAVGEAGFRDETVTPAADFRLKQINVRVEDFSDQLSQAMPLAASLQVASGGKLDLAGKLTPATAAADLKVQIAGLALKQAQPYLSGLARLDLADGRVSTQGRLNLGGKGASYRGGFAVDDLRLVEAGTTTTFLAWKSLNTSTLDVTGQRLDIAELTLDGLDTVIVIEQDKSTNLTKVLKSADAAATPAGAPPPTAAAAPAAAATNPPAVTPQFLVNIDRLRVRNGELDFSDLSLALPFGTRVHGLNGAINGLSSRPGGLGQVELDGQVDDYGLARAVGQVNFFQPTGFMDLKVVFRNVEMSRLTPYTATFAGRKIDSGKLSLDLEYKIDKRQLRGDNQIIMDRLKLGERVDTPGASNLPLDLAIAILEDSDGRIDLGLPVSGSLDDPQFSYGAIVWKAILNVITKIATAPFRALGALFGGGEKFEKIAFEAGAPGLTPPEREKLLRLAEALKKRPALALEIHGVHAEIDRPALQDQQLRRTLATLMGLGVKADEDPGPLSTQQPKVREALEKLFAERAGAAELAALKDGFRKANPGQLEESTTGRMMSRLTGLFREQRKLDDGEVAQLKGADFHAVLYERLRQQETVADSRLLALATARGEATAAALQAAGAPADRLSVAAPEKVETEGRDVPLKLVLGAAKKAAQ